MTIPRLILFVLFSVLPVVLQAQKQAEPKTVDEQVFYKCPAGESADGVKIPEFWIMGNAMLPSQYKDWITKNAKFGSGENLLTISYRETNQEGKEWLYARTKVLMPDVLNWETNVQPELHSGNGDWGNVKTALRDIVRKATYTDIVKYISIRYPELEKKYTKEALTEEELDKLRTELQDKLKYDVEDFVTITGWAENGYDTDFVTAYGGGNKNGEDLLAVIWGNIDAECRKLLYLERNREHPEDDMQHIVEATALRADWLYAVSDTRSKKNRDEWKAKYAEYEENIKTYKRDEIHYLEVYKDQDRFTISDALENADVFFRYAAEVMK